MAESGELLKEVRRIADALTVLVFIKLNATWEDMRPIISRIKKREAMDNEENI